VLPRSSRCSGPEVLHPEGPTLSQTAAHVLLVAIPLLAAEVHRTRHALVHERLERRAEQERLRIARDLHDVVAHTLTTVNVQAATAAQLLERNPAHARAALETIEHASRAAIGELRAILGVLRGGDLPDAPRAPAPGVDDVAELVRRARAEGVDVELRVSGERPSHVAEAVSLAAFRIVQESLTNARRHAAGAPVSVSLAFDAGALTVAVDNRVGTPANGHSGGVGIVGMTERAASVGGTLRAAAVDGGFRVSARLPYLPA
jgi:signal transduction histidine kinase